MIAFKLCSTCQICPEGILSFKSKRPPHRIARSFASPCGRY